MADLSGVPLGARFSLVTNRLGYCGPPDAGSALYRAATEGTDLERAGASLLAFEALAPYLRALGRRHGLDPLHREVVEAYWIGNRLLDAFTADDFAPILDALARRGLPASSARWLREHLPSGAFPHHAFHVAFVGVGAVTGHAPTNLPTMERCRPAWATVRSVGPGTATIARPSVTLGAGGFAWSAPTTSTVPVDPKLLPGLAAGETVAVHWDTPVLRLTPAEAEALERYSRRAFELAGPSLAGLLARSADGEAARRPGPTSA